VLSREANEFLSSVGSETPAGKLLRRYWHPVGVASEFTDEKPKKRVRILGEDLVLFRLPDGTYGLVAESCSHRRASLYYGFIDDDGLRCAYHGWKYSLEGRCLDHPFETDAEFKKDVRHTAYPVERLAGLLFAYLGPPDAKPLLPRWDYLVREDWLRKLEVHPVLNCNWLQPMENAVDPSHTRFLHAETFRRKGIKRDVAYNLRKVDRFEYEPCEWGIRKRRVFSDGEKEIGHLLVFPTILRHPGSLHFRAPIDDTHTQIYRVVRTNEATRADGNDLEVVYVTYKDNDGEFHMENFPSQDAMAWETQGPVTDRSKELLGESDRGITAFRKMLREQIEIVMRGGDPMALVRDPVRNEVINFVTSEWKGTED
jgi:5,5'-dehydrodivanillate O-demethylase